MASIIKREDRVADPLHFTITLKNYLEVARAEGTTEEVAERYGIPIEIAHIIRRTDGR